MVQPPLALLLLRASRWFDDRLLERLALRGWPALSSAQSLVFAHLDPDGTPPAELARRLGQRRQSAQQLVARLVDLGLLAVVEDPSRARGRLVVLTERGRALAADARAELRRLEREAGAADSVAELRALLMRLRLD